MNYSDVVRDFAFRTRVNLGFIDQHANEPDAEVYEVTQLINLMLGLLVFPNESDIHSIRETPISELEQLGWPKITPTERVVNSPNYRACTNLRELLRYLRNSIAHFNLEFVPDGQGRVAGLHMWNRRGRDGPKTWETYLTLQELRQFANCLIDLLQADRPNAIWTPSGQLPLDMEGWE